MLLSRYEARCGDPAAQRFKKDHFNLSNNGETFKVGDTVTVKWLCIDDIMYVDIRLSPDRGKTWILLNAQSIAYNDAARWSHFKWVIPEKIKDKTKPNACEFALAGNSDCLFRVENYSPNDSTEISMSEKPLTILPCSGAIGRDRHDGRNRGSMWTPYYHKTPSRPMGALPFGSSIYGEGLAL